MTTQKNAFAGFPVSVNKETSLLVEHLVEEAEALRCKVTRGDAGERLIDLGANVEGGYKAGIRLAEICMGGLGSVAIHGSSGLTSWPLAVTVTSSNPVIACLASQYGGWTMNDEATGFFALGSGPARALARKEDLFTELGYIDNHTSGALVIEGDKAPPTTLVKRIAEDCHIKPENLTILYAPTGSLAGTVQIAARVLEVALHKAHALGFPLENIVDGVGTAPLAPPNPDLITAMGRTNDAIIFAGHVQLFVHGTDASAEDLANKLPSSASEAYGKPFADIFSEVGGDFYKIDPMLFSPAKVIVSNLDTGQSFHAGHIASDLVDASFGRPHAA